jgi:hypothetical protein
VTHLKYASTFLKKIGCCERAQDPIQTKTKKKEKKDQKKKIKNIRQDESSSLLEIYGRKCVPLCSDFFQPVCPGKKGKKKKKKRTLTEQD